MMELRHLRCFLAVAEELHFACAAEKLHIEQSLLSRAVKELEEELGVVLFARTTRSTHLTRAGKLFFEHVPRVLSALQQARDTDDGYSFIPARFDSCSPLLACPPNECGLVNA